MVACQRALRQLLSLLPRKGEAVAVIWVDPIPTARQHFDLCERCGLRRWLGERVTKRWVSDGPPRTATVR